MNAARSAPGDILEIETRGGFGYIQYVGTHPLHGDTILVSPEIHAERAADLARLFDDGYIAFYPVRAAVRQNLVRVIGKTKVPTGLPPTRLRRAGVRSDRGVETWVIEDESGDTVTRGLSEEERRLPIGAIWNHEYLVHRLEQGWRPELEG